jgi:replicative DNA helicase
MIDDLARVQPHDLLAEMVVLGIMLSSPLGADRGAGALVVEEFFDHRHRLVFETVSGMSEAGEPTDVTAVASRMQLSGTIGRAGGLPYLAELHRAAQPVSNLDWYARQIIDTARRRKLMDAAVRSHQRAQTPNGETADDLLAFALEELGRINRADEGDLNGGLSVADLMGEPPGYDWLIPGLLERGDRLILTGGEGAGKSTLGRQVAITTAAGLHPFTFREQEPKRVLVIDCENGLRLSMRRYRPLFAAAESEGCQVDPENFRLESHPGGLDLARRDGAAWLMRRVEHYKPDLLVVGPLYRLHAGDPSDERDARRIAEALDKVREVIGAAVLLEAHSPHQTPGVKRRNLRPVGSSLWMRWPEFGYGIRYADEDTAYRFRVMDVEPWRGSRDERFWPKRIRAGGMSSPWPWVVDEPQTWANG